MSLDVTKPFVHKSEQRPSVLVGKTPNGKYVVAIASTLVPDKWIARQPQTLEELEEDFMNLPERKERWINFYNGYASTYHASPSRANSCRRETWMGTAKVVIEGDRVVKLELINE